MTNETGLTRNKVIAELTRSPHSNLIEYATIGRVAASEDPDFYAHLVAWNDKNGHVRDAKVALPVLALTGTDDPELVENALAHIATLDPRNVVRAVRFTMEVKPSGKARKVRRVVEQYLRAREGSPVWFERTAMQHRRALKELYALCHIKPSPKARSILFENKKVGVFGVIARLRTMAPDEAAAAIIKHKIPFLVAKSALGGTPPTGLAMALMERMSPTEVVTNVKALESMGVKHVPELRAALDAKIAGVAKSKVNILKTARAAESIGDSKLKQRLLGAQEKQIDAAGVDGNWLVLGDKSSSMSEAIEASRMIAATLARFVKGDVHLVFFNDSPHYVNATGKSYDALLADTKRVVASGMTSIGCGVAYAIANNLDVDGIAIVTDGGENTHPVFAAAYRSLCEKLGKDVPVYVYQIGPLATLHQLCAQHGVDLQTFEIGGQPDYYSLPNLVATMRTNKFSLADAIMATPLKTMKDVFNK